MGKDATIKANAATFGLSREEPTPEEGATIYIPLEDERFEAVYVPPGEEATVDIPGLGIVAAVVAHGNADEESDGEEEDAAVQ